MSASEHNASSPAPVAASRPHRYRLYLDELGDHTYKQLNDIASRYLGLLGVWFRQADEYVAFADDLEKFKRDIFGARPDKPVVLHRSDIINRKGPFGILCNTAVQQRFDEGLLGVMADPGDVFGKRVIEAAGTKFNQNEWRGQVTGYGKVWLK